MSELCPKCGAGLEGKNPYLPSYGRYECGSYANPGTETMACLRNQLAQANERIVEWELKYTAVAEAARILLDGIEDQDAGVEDYMYRVVKLDDEDALMALEGDEVDE